MSKNNTAIITGDALADYHFGEEHPFSSLRHQAFIDGLHQYQLSEKVDWHSPHQAEINHLKYFHTDDYIQKVQECSKTGNGYIDHGDTPSRIGIFEAASCVVGSVLHMTDLIMQGEYQHGFVPIAGLHHGYRDHCSGFCVFNDCCISIEHLRKKYNLNRILYVDIDAHHGDGILYNYESDSQLFIIDFHQDGRTIYPGTGDADEIGTGPAQGTKRNYPLDKHSNDEKFAALWEDAEAFIHAIKPEFIIFQCGADSMKGDPITDLEFSEKSYQLAARRLCDLAKAYAKNRIIGLGGGGYNMENISKAWPSVIKEMII